jgi:hypothetical protein
MGAMPAPHQQLLSISSSLPAPRCAVYTAGSKGTVVPGRYTPATFVPGYIKPGWIEKKDCAATTLPAG